MTDYPKEGNLSPLKETFGKVEKISHSASLEQNEWSCLCWCLVYASVYYETEAYWRKGHVNVREEERREKENKE